MSRTLEASLIFLTVSASIWFLVDAIQMAYDLTIKLTN